MAYTFKDALDDFSSILAVFPSDKITNLDNTGEQGKLIETENGEKIVVFLSPLGYNSSANKRYFDARDSGAVKRLVAYTYAKKHQYKYFYLGIRPELYGNDYIFSLECPEDVLQNTTGNIGAHRGNTGNQINFDRTFIPNKQFERITTRQGIFISCVHRDFLKTYLDIYDNRQLIVGFDDYNQVNELVFESRFSNSNGVAYNRIFFGAPGTGKSFKLEEEKNDLLLNGGKYERVTFHPDYSYAQFVGTYKPVPSEDENGTEVITYKYTPGPFMRILVESLRNIDSEIPHLLIIEEINRANVAAVFGEVFQLLDRTDGVSEYAINLSEDMKSYISSELGIDSNEINELKLPDNLFIWATMNSADQGVFPMDTAFKRRWEFEYIGIDDKEEKVLDYKTSYNLNWNQMRKALNKILSSETIKLNEDKLMGPFFINPIKIASKDSLVMDGKIFNTIFKNKVIMYLFEDAVRSKRNKLFASGLNRYSQICSKFDSNFNNDGTLKGDDISVIFDIFNKDEKKTLLHEYDPITFGKE